MTTLHHTMARRVSQKIWSALDAHLLPVASSGVLLAISGGPDSRALLEAVARWRGRLSNRFVVAAFDHGTRKDSKREAELVVYRARRLGFIAHSERLVDEILANEQNLRNARYAALKDIASKYNCRVIVTAHHRDDESEGYFMALMGVGGGELGASMKKLSMNDDFYLCRPFLSLSKKDLLLSLSLNHQTDFVIDPLDKACIGQRALVRNEIFPQLFKKAPLVKKRLSDFALAQREHKDALEDLAKKVIIWEDNQAKIGINPPPKTIILSYALWQLLKKWSNGRDLRSSQGTIDKIIKDLGVYGPGLDPDLNAFNLRDLSVKQYQFPGVVVEKGPFYIIAKRI